VRSLEGGKSVQGSGVGEEEEEEEDEEEAAPNLLAILEREEKKRAFQQISDARGYVDLRDVVSVEVGVDEGEIDAAVGIFDVGGLEGLEVVEDKGLLSRQRSFVVTTRGGTSVRFEVRYILSLPSLFSSFRQTDLPCCTSVLLHLRSGGMGRPPPRPRHLLVPPRTHGRHRANGALFLRSSSSTSHLVESPLARSIARARGGDRREGQLRRRRCRR